MPPVILLTTDKLPALTHQVYSLFFSFPLHISCPHTFSLSVRLNQCCSGLAFAQSAAAPLGKSQSHWSISPSHYFLLGGHNQNWMATSQRQTLLLRLSTRACLLSLHWAQWCFSFLGEKKAVKFECFSPILSVLVLFLLVCVHRRECAFPPVLVLERCDFLSAQISL